MLNPLLSSLPRWIKRLDKPRAWLERHARIIALLVALVLCLNAAILFALGDHAGFRQNWRDHVAAIGIGLLLAALGTLVDALCWTLLARRFSIDIRGAWGFCVFMCAFAATLLPLKLGRLLRPDAIGRLRLGRRLHAVQVEGIMVMFEAVSAAGLFAIMVAWPFVGWPALAAGALVALALFAMAHRLSELLVGTRLALPARFWFQPQTTFLFSLVALGWLIDGSILFVLLRGAPGDIAFNQVIAITLGSLVAGSGSGMPGGIGVVEGAMGISLALLAIPAAYLAFAVTAYRLISFWCLVPLGWLALVLIQKRAGRLHRQLEAEAAENFPAP